MNGVNVMRVNVRVRGVVVKLRVYLIYCIERWTCVAGCLWLIGWVRLN